MEIMQEMLQYVKPGFAILVVTLYFLGIVFKRLKRIPDEWIPLLLSGCGILIATLSVAANNMQYANFAAQAFDAITQGVVCAGMSVYINQLIKQCGGNNHK